MIENPFHRAKTMLPLRAADMEILLILRGEALHAYGISKKAEEEDSGVSLEIGSLYRTLNRLETDGLIEEAPVQALGPQGQRRRTWRITPLGRAVVRSEAERLQRVVELARKCDFLGDLNS